MIFKTPDTYFLTAGQADSQTHLNAFDGALLDAGIGDTNLVKMSSILPPAAKKIEPLKLPFGSLVPLAYASITSDMPGEICSAAVAVGIPEDDHLPGLIMEYSARGHKEDIERIVRSMVETGFNMRGKKLKEIKSISVEHQVKTIGTAFAAVVLWD